MPAPTTQVTLRTAVVLPFVIIFLLTFGVIVYVQKFHYEETVENISDRHLSVLTDSVHDNLDKYLGEPINAMLAVGQSISYHNLYQPNQNSEIQNYLFRAFKDLYSTIPQLDVLSFGSEDQDYVGFRRESNHSYTLMLKDNRTEGEMVIFRGSKISDDIRYVIPNYNPTVRPWYQPVSEQQRPMWSDIYANADERQEITLSAMMPIEKHGKFCGVLAADIKINTFNAFLHQLKSENKASVYVMDKAGRLVAHSGEGSVISWGTELSKKGQRLLATESVDPVIQFSAERANALKLTERLDSYTFQFDNEGQRYFSRVTPYTDSVGLTWFIGISIPESELLGSLPQNQRDSWFIGLIVSIIGILFSLLILNRITRPINATATAAQHIAEGNWESSLPRPGYVYETTMLVSAFNEMALNLQNSFKALREQLVFDSLTRLYSRQGLIEASNKMNTAAKGSVYLVGINRFRDINDSIGHNQGDQLLMVIAERLKQQFQDDYVLARIGGDEFALYAPSASKAQDITLTEHRILQVFASPFTINAETVVLKVSIGVVEAMPEQNMSLWLRNASIALSYAKQDQHTGICHYSPEMASASKHRTKMLTRIQNGINNREFIPHYQPLIDLESGTIKGAEALARWQSDAGMISPLDFIPLAEETNMIKAIGQQILYQACRDTKLAIERGQWPEDFQLHVNISVNQISSPEFVGTVETILEETLLPTKNLTLELTESRIIDSAPTTLENMSKLRDMGIGIAIDDFGTGYSSLAYLHSLPFNCLKIDRSFINRLTKEDIDNSVVAAIINITKGMKANVVAEGVETEVQADLLRKLGCDQVQGFFYSRPLPFEEWPIDLLETK